MDRPVIHSSPLRAERSSRDERGMTLVEVLVGVTILAFVALGIMAFLGTAMRQNQLSLERSTATAIASERIQALARWSASPRASAEQSPLPRASQSATSAMRRGVWR